MLLYKSYKSRGRKSRTFKAKDPIDYLYYKYAVRDLYEKKLIRHLPKIFESSFLFPEYHEVLVPFKLELSQLGLLKARELWENINED